jgi:hypothetical protein
LALVPAAAVRPAQGPLAARRALRNRFRNGD